MTNRVFTKEELAEMGKRTIDLLTEAIDNGNSERAKILADRMYQENSKMHDMYIQWTAGLMDCIYRDGGEETLYKALKKVINDYRGPHEDVRNVDFATRVDRLATSMRGHLQPVEITEDDEKVCMTMHPCGSGQMLCQKGAYEPPINLSMIEKPHAMTWGKTDFPIYCTFMPVREILSIEQLGYPTNVTFHEGKNFAKEPCTVCIYKKVEDTPEEIYTRVGKTKSDELK